MKHHHHQRKKKHEDEKNFGGGGFGGGDGGVGRGKERMNHLKTLQLVAVLGCNSWLVSVTLIGV